MAENSIVKDMDQSKKAAGKYLRFVPLQRIEHWFFMASFSLLGLTGLIQRYGESPISQGLANLMGGVENLRVIHRISATVMMFVTVYHIGLVLYKIYVKRTRMTMLPAVSDLRNAIQSLAYNLGIRKESIQQGRYSFEEKAEYWAVVWGTIVMAATGFMMWNPIITTKFLPGELIPTAKSVHGLEAILAVLAIFLWHFYQVLVKTFNRSMFTGYVTEEQMIHEHPLELADIKAGTANRPPDPVGEDKRRRIFWPAYAVATAVMLVLIYLFVNYEETAIATIPPASNIEVFVPLTPTPLPTPRPTSTPAPIEVVTWNAGVGELFTARCGLCHSSTGGNQGGLDLTSYLSAMEGGTSGPVIIPNNPDNSLIIIIQSTGEHPGQFSAEELVLVKEWIEAGAPEE